MPPKRPLADRRLPPAALRRGGRASLGRDPPPSSAKTRPLRRRRASDSRFPRPRLDPVSQPVSESFFGPEPAPSAGPGCSTDPPRGLPAAPHSAARTSPPGTPRSDRRVLGSGGSEAPQSGAIQGPARRSSLSPQEEHPIAQGPVLPGPAALGGCVSATTARRPHPGVRSRRVPRPPCRLPARRSGTVLPRTDILARRPAGGGPRRSGPPEIREPPPPRPARSPGMPPRLPPPLRRV